jgi:hypothetical protein
LVTSRPASSTVSKFDAKIRAILSGEAADVLRAQVMRLDQPDETRDRAARLTQTFDRPL